MLLIQSFSLCRQDFLVIIQLHFPPKSQSLLEPITHLIHRALPELDKITSYNQTTTWLYFLCDLQSLCVWQGNENRVGVVFGVTEF